MRVRHRCEPAAPLVRAVAVRRQTGIHVGRAQRQPAARVHRDVLRVGVEPVERQLEAGHRLEEVLRRVHGSRRHRLERDRAEQLSAPRRARECERNLDAVARRVGDDRSVIRGAERELRVRTTVLALERAGVERSHRGAHALVQVVRVVAAAQCLRELIGDVGARRGRAPRVVGTTPDLEIEAEAGERDAASVEPAAVQVLLHQDLGREVADLRPRDEDRMAALRSFGSDQERVRHDPTRRGRREGCIARDDRDVATGVDAHVPGADPVRPIRVRER